MISMNREYESVLGGASSVRILGAIAMLGYPRTEPKVHRPNWLAVVERMYRVWMVSMNLEVELVRNTKYSAEYYPYNFPGPTWCSPAIYFVHRAGHGYEPKIRFHMKQMLKPYPSVVSDNYAHDAMVRRRYPRTLSGAGTATEWRTFIFLLSDDNNPNGHPEGFSDLV